MRWTIRHDYRHAEASARAVHLVLDERQPVRRISGGIKVLIGRSSHTT
jgi:hypothetical protein